MQQLFKAILDFMMTYTVIYPIFMSVGWLLGAGCFRWYKVKKSDNYEPSVTLLVSMFNESELIEETMRAIQNINYPNLKVILVDDASHDNTVELVENYITQHTGINFQLVKMPQNGGKARALNYAIEHYVDTELVSVIDADSLVEPQAIARLAHNFSDPQVAAVTGKPVVRNRTTILGTLQTLEYVSIIDLIKRAQSVLFHRIMTVSGVLVMYRLADLQQIHFFNPSAMTEDIDVTWRLYHIGKQIRYEPRAVTYILVPEKIRGFIRQRTRWSVGGLEVFAKNIGWVLRSAPWGTKFMLIETFFSHLWSWSFIISTIDYVVTDIASHNFKLALPIILLYTFITLIMTINSLHSDQGFTEVSKRDLLVWPIYYFFYWLINILCSLTSEFKMVFSKVRNGTWTSPDRGVK